MTNKKSTIWQEELRKHLDNATPTEDWSKLVEQDDRIIQFDAGEEVKDPKFINHEIEPTDFVKPRATKEEVLKATELLEGNMGEGKAEVIKAIAEHEKLHEQAKADYYKGRRKFDPKKYNVAEDMHINAQILQSMKDKEVEFIKSLPDLLEEDKRSNRFFGMRLNGKSIDDIENTFLAMFAEFVSLMALFIGMLGFGVLMWAIFG